MVCQSSAFSLECGVGRRVSGGAGGGRGRSEGGAALSAGGSAGEYGSGSPSISQKCFKEISPRLKFYYGNILSKYRVFRNS
jgi:hypothetical protein